MTERVGGSSSLDRQWMQESTQEVRAAEHIRTLLSANNGPWKYGELANSVSARTGLGEYPMAGAIWQLVDSKELEIRLDGIYAGASLTEQR
ncbi:MAG TPA: hypothetical protein VMR18_02735 [Candidatus Saccharimonadales bacterium]|jgi:hypothetical protein|nr:hypothetical protein [Candidatus Saccharimonadales bacterium]